MNKLEIYSAYLPYKLHVGFETDDDTHEVVSVGLDGLRLVSPHYNYGYCDFDTPKPILRNLSDLTKEIEHEGEVFVPIDLLDSDLYPIDYFKDTDHYDYVLRWLRSEDKSHHLQFLPYGLIQQLIKWKFNIFNLPQDEYVAVTKEFNPYK